jgi:hypothetical protein
MKEFLLEMEVAMTAVLEYSPILGWQSPDKVMICSVCYICSSALLGLRSTRTYEMYVDVCKIKLFNLGLVIP